MSKIPLSYILKSSKIKYFIPLLQCTLKTDALWINFWHFAVCFWHWLNAFKYKTLLVNIWFIIISKWRKHSTSAQCLLIVFCKFDHLIHTALSQIIDIMHTLSLTDHHWYTNTDTRHLKHRLPAVLGTDFLHHLFSI